MLVKIMQWVQSLWRSVRYVHIAVFTLVLLGYAFVRYQEEIGLLQNKYDSPSRPSSPLLPRIISESEYYELIELLAAFMEVCRRANITVTMSFGTLIGSYMYHDVVPWDDDIDLWLPYEDLPKLKRYFQEEAHWKTHHICAWRQPLDEFDADVLRSFPSEASDAEMYKSRYQDDNIEPSHVFKFFKASSPHAGGYQWRWPFLDVVFYKENRTHVWNYELRNVMYIPKSHFYPLTKRPFSNLELLAPFDPGYILRHRYTNFLCDMGDYNHKQERRFFYLNRKYWHTECSRLFDTYPQVWAEHMAGGQVKETLKVAGKTLQTLYIQGPQTPDQPSKRPYDF